MSTTPNDGGPAFPCPQYHGGMSLRDWFAGQTITACFASAQYQRAATSVDKMASECYRMADAMLRAREGKP